MSFNDELRAVRARVARRLKKMFGERRRRLRASRRTYRIEGLRHDASNKRYRERIKGYWTKHFGRSVHPLWHLAWSQVVGVEDVRYVPLHEWWTEILPFLNDLSMRPAFRDKNLSDVFLRYANVPRTIVKRMHGSWYAADDRPISFQDAAVYLAAESAELIIKPSQTDNGYGIRTLLPGRSGLTFDGTDCRFEDVAAFYGDNFIVQERLRQHASLSRIHPDSVNTIRVVTLRWHGETRVLLAFLRFGVGGRMTDNASTGGICCGIDEHGRLHDSAVDLSGRIYGEHPTTGYPFAEGLEVPAYREVCDTAQTLHGHLFHFDIVSWDFAIDPGGRPVFLEVNFKGAIDLYQFATRRPLFGELTESVLEAVRDRR